ncbi:nuclear transport factor 2 family protein [Sphingobacterium shayense]|uniref:nuclear transport factor 2 family protein n=1 Tax=Sphingobacterium shayense TaxID=626343 RepID=UPI001555D581|nr:nuclear transport factor 2 family protein [Sphingobacterium shayense]NQD69808.1 nuclear transport factor 2 family protein [Sphingobacterium shayense]
MSQNVIIAQSYFNAIAKGDFDTVRTLFADDVVWHQPGEGVQSGTYKGMDNVFNHLGNFMKWSNGTFAIDNIEYTTDNGDLVLASIHFEAEKANRKLSMKGVDLLRIEGEKIKEVWLFSENIQEEDDFWNHVANN